MYREREQLKLYLCEKIDEYYLSYHFCSGERCNTPNNYDGTCASLQDCPSLMKYYGQSPDHPTVIKFLITSQKICGTRSINKEPLVCCTDPVDHESQPSLIREPTQKPQTISQSQPQSFNEQYEQPEEAPPEVITQGSFPNQEPSTYPTDSTCSDPNGVIGFCKSIKACPIILNEFLARSQDSVYIDYLKQSNVNCRNIKPLICCPFENRSAGIPVDQSNVNIQGRLLTPEEGCGFSERISNNKIVGGSNAKPGNL